MNITDVGHMTDEVSDTGRDKMELAESDEGLSAADIAEKYTEAFLEDADLVGIERADLYPRATDHIPEMISMIETLIEKGHAHEVDGTVYFETTTFPGYGKLSGNTLDQLGAGHRTELATDPGKRHAQDFALWKKGREKSRMDERGRRIPDGISSAPDVTSTGRSSTCTRWQRQQFPTTRRDRASEGAVGHPAVDLGTARFLQMGARRCESAKNISGDRLAEQGIDPLGSMVKARHGSDPMTSRGRRWRRRPSLNQLRRHVAEGTRGRRPRTRRRRSSIHGPRAVANASKCRRSSA